MRTDDDDLDDFDGHDDDDVADDNGLRRPRRRRPVATASYFSDDFDDRDDNGLHPELSADDAAQFGAKRAVARGGVPAADQLAAALVELEERFEAALERHTARLMAIMRDRRQVGPMEPVVTRRTSVVSLHSRPSTTKGSRSHSMMGLRQHSHGSLLDDILVEPKYDPATSHSLGPRTVRWQWQSSAGPWMDYEDPAHERIEAAYQRGESLVRLKSGPTGKVPMEVFFVDMLQRDPESRRVRKVRRHGPRLSCQERMSRYRSGLLRYVTTGRSMFESMQAYRDRTFWHSGYQDGLDSEDKGSHVVGKSCESLGKDHSLRHICRSCVHACWYSSLSVIALLLQCWWIWYSTDDTVGIPLYQQGALANILEHFFCLFFAAELAINILALSKRRLWYLNPWLSLDAACVFSSFLDVLVLPPLSLAIRENLMDIPGGEVLRTLRLVRLFRISRIFGYSHAYSTIIKGMVSGMRSAALILALLSVVLFAFAVVLRTQSEQEQLKPYFGSVSTAMRTLLTRGLFLDGVRDLLDDMVEAGLWMPIISFSLFMYVTFFGLMSMLVGAFCSVADKVHKEEEDRMMTTRLRSSLRDIVECYMDDDSNQMTINQKTFRLLLKNPDVQALLKSSQTDIRGLRSVMNTLLANSASEIPFSEMLDLIVHLRAGKAAAVSDVAHLEGYVWSSFERLEHLILTGEERLDSLQWGPSEACSEANAYPSADGMEKTASLRVDDSRELATPRV